MQLRDLLPPEHIYTPLDARTLREALAVMVAALVADGSILEPAPVERLLEEGRNRAVVPIGPRVVLPHHRTDAVDHLVLALGIAPEPLQASAFGISTEPQLVALILAPPGAPTMYLQTVSTLARLFRRADLVEALLRARTPAQALAIGELAESRVLPRLSVRDMMAQRKSVPPSAPVRDVVDVMIEQAVKAIPVVGEKGEVLGIVTEWDVMRALLPQLPRAEDDPEAGSLVIPPELRVKDIMTRSVLCISEDMGLDEASNLMINKDVEQFPVVSEGRLTGFLSRSDIIRKLFGH